MSIPADPVAGSQRGGWGLSGKGPHRFIEDEVVPVNAKNRSESPTVKAVKPGGEDSSERPGLLPYSSTDRTAALYMRVLVVRSGGFKVGGGRGKTKKGGPLMTSSYSANRDNHF